MGDLRGGKRAANNFVLSLGHKLDFHDSDAIANIVYGHGKHFDSCARDVRKYMSTTAVKLTEEQIESLIAETSKAIRGGI